MHQQQVYKYGCIFCFSLFLFTLVRLDTLLFAFLSFYLGYKFISNLTKHYLQHGIISLAPIYVQNLLLRRSIFDVLCDFWFMKATNVLKIIFKPFIVPFQPQDAVNALSDLSPSVRDKILMKGIVNVFPQMIKEKIIPETEIERNIPQISEKYKEEKEEEEEEKEEDQTSVSQTKQTIIRQKKKNMKKRNSRIILHRKFMQQSSEDQKNCEKILNQSQKKSQFNHPSSSQRWDKLQIYQNMQQKQEINQIQASNIVNYSKTAIQMIKSLIHLKNISIGASQISRSRIIFFMLIFWVLILLQLKINKRTRTIIVKILCIMFGIITTSGAIGTTGLLIYRTVNAIQYKKQKNIKKYQK